VVERWALPTLKKVEDIQVKSITNLPRSSFDQMRMPAVKYAVILGLKKSRLTQRWTCISVILVTEHTIGNAFWT